MSVTVNISGFNELESILLNKCIRLSDATMDQMYEMAKGIMSNSQDEVPKDTTALVQSGFIVEDNNSIIFGYGGPNQKINPKTEISTEEYALKVHEDLHMLHIHGGKAKFLEDPFRSAVEDLNGNLIAPLKSLLK